MNMLHVSIIEDEVKLARALSEGLQCNGYRTTVIDSGEIAMQRIHETVFDVILLDLILPGSSGIEILFELRRIGSTTPVLILTSRSSLDDRVIGLDAGADDYLLKPFAFPELLARIRALHRRANPKLQSVLQLANLKMDLQTHSAVREDTPLELTVKEFELLAYLLLNETVVTRDMIARDVWKSPFRSTTLDNVIDVHVARIRRKLDDPFAMKLLHTIRGVGFILRPPEDN